MADTREAAPAYRGNHQIKPLPFDPSTLHGLSERLLRSHHENNYTGAVKRLNPIQQALGSHPQPGLGHATPRDGHVRALVRDGLRSQCARVPRRLLPEHSVGRGESPR